jgi:hypothetical protein
MEVMKISQMSTPTDVVFPMALYKETCVTNASNFRFRLTNECNSSRHHITSIGSRPGDREMENNIFWQKL